MLKFLSRIAQIVVLFGLLASAPVPAVAAEYTLRSGDKIKVKVYEWPDLTSDFTIDSNGAITLPVIGTVTVAGLRATQVSDLISDRLQKKTNASDKPIASVEVTQVQPIFVLGDVAKPGEYPWQPGSGLTVLQAIGIAGGFYRPADFGYLRFERDVITSRGDLEVLSPRITRLMARQARLNAELQERNDILFPPELTHDTSKTVVQMLADERTAFTTAREAFLRKLDNYAQVSKIYEQEIVSLMAQIQTEKAQQESVQKELEQVREMATKGLGLAPRQLTLERTVLQLAEVQQSLETLVLRARQNIAATEQLGNDAKAERRTKINIDIQSTHAELEEDQKKIETLQRLIYEASVTGPLQAKEQLTMRSRKHEVLISRKQGGEVQKINGDESFVLEPGDVVEVVPSLMTEPAQADATTTPQPQIQSE
jgi:protein involved in polysaccharide export with SLBB domain